MKLEIYYRMVDLFVSNQVTKASPASLPNCSKSCAMVVSGGGQQRAAAWISSNPIIEKSSGI